MAWLSLSLSIPLPFSLPPNPLPLSMPATQVKQSQHINRHLLFYSWVLVSLMTPLILMDHTQRKRLCCNIIVANLLMGKKPSLVHLRLQESCTREDSLLHSILFQGLYAIRKEPPFLLTIFLRRRKEALLAGCVLALKSIANNDNDLACLEVAHPFSG